MTETEARADLHRYLRAAREALLWKLDGLSEYDIRRPMTPTGTNLLGLVKHLTAVELGYFGYTFGRPFDEPIPWMGADVEPQRGHVGYCRGVSRAHRRAVQAGGDAL